VAVKKRDNAGVRDIINEDIVHPIKIIFTSYFDDVHLPKLNLDTWTVPFYLEFYINKIAEIFQRPPPSPL